MTCIDCIHFEACERMIHDTNKMFKALLSEALKMNCDFNYDSTNTLSGAEICQCFQAHSNFVELPCKLGDTVYYFNHVGTIYSQKVMGFIVNSVGVLVDSDVMFDSNLIGDKFFLTREETERALKESEG